MAIPARSLLLPAALILAAVAPAATYRDGDAADTWNTTDLNWDAGTAWPDTLTEDAIFGGIGETVTVDTVNARNLTFTSGGYTLTGGTLTLASAAVLSADTSATVGSVLAGAATSLGKAGTGTLVLTAANTYAGATTVNAGTLQIGDDTNATARAGTGALQIGNNTATLRLNGPATLGNATVTSSAGGLLQNTGAGQVTINNGALAGTVDGGAAGIVLANALTATLLIRGEITINNAGSNQVIRSMAAGTRARFTAANTGATTWWIGTESAANALSLDIAAGKTVTLNNTQTAGPLYYQDLTGAGNFTFNSAGGTTTATILGTSTLTGTLTANRTVNFGNGGAGGLAGATRIVNSSAVTFNSSTDNTYSGTIGGTGSVTKLAANTLVLSGANTHTGGTTVAAGTLATGNVAALGAGPVALAGGTLQIGDGTGATGVTLGAGKNLTTAAASVSVLRWMTTTSTLTLAGAGKYDFSLGALTLDLHDAFNAAGTYGLITGGTGHVDAASYTFAGADTAAFTFGFSQGTLSVTAIPEPAGYGLAGAGALAALARVRRRRAR